ncbi:MAG TPA: hypothetical protein VGE84_09145 [Allosphingosinicella sp.]
MKIAMVAFEGFTDVDLFLPWDLFYRVKDATYAAYPGEWDVRICADAARVRSYSGLAIDRHEPLEWANEAHAVFVVSGPGSRTKIKDPAFLAAAARRVAAAHRGDRFRRADPGCARAAGRALRNHLSQRLRRARSHGREDRAAALRGPRQRRHRRRLPGHSGPRRLDRGPPDRA